MGAAAAAIESPWATCKPHLGPLATLRRVVADTLYEIPDWRRSTTRWTRVRIPSVTVATVVLGLARRPSGPATPKIPRAHPPFVVLVAVGILLGGLWDHVRRQARPGLPPRPSTVKRCRPPLRRLNRRPPRYHHHHLRLRRQHRPRWLLLRDPAHRVGPPAVRRPVINTSFGSGWRITHGAR